MLVQSLLLVLITTCTTLQSKSSPTISMIPEQQCDIDIFDMSSDNPEVISFKKPFLLRNALKEWPLEQDFIRKYGDLKVQTGSESSIVYSHGSADSMNKLKDLVNNSSQGNVLSDNLSFDMNILQKYPNINKLYQTPKVLIPLFRSEMSTPVLSVGQLYSGLPLHSHGDAYLGLVSGRKQWLLYRPGEAPPLDIQKEWNPFLPITNWFERLHDFNHSDHSPLYCMQQPGELVFVPAGWSHSTYNLMPLTTNSQPYNGGDDMMLGLSELAVGIGMQTTWLAEEREQHCRQTLLQNPLDYDSLVGVATSIFHKAFGAKTTSGSDKKGSYLKSPALLDKSLDESIALLKRAIDIRPNYPEARNLLVILLFRRGSDYFQEAMSEMRMFEELLDSFAEDKANMGVASSACGLAAAYYRLSLPLSANKFETDALRILSKSIFLDNRNPKSHAQRIVLYQRRGEYRKALSALEEMDVITANDDIRGQDMLSNMKALILSKISEEKAEF